MLVLPEPNLRETNAATHSLMKKQASLWKSIGWVFWCETFTFNAKVYLINAYILQCSNSRTSPLFKDVETFHHKEKGAHRRQLVDGSLRTVCVFVDKCKVRQHTNFVFGHIGIWDFELMCVTDTTNVSLCKQLIQTHPKQFQCKNDTEMYQSFILENEEFKAITKGIFRKHKPAWIHKMVQEWVNLLLLCLEYLEVDGKRPEQCLQPCCCGCKICPGHRFKLVPLWDKFKMYFHAVV